MFTLKIGGQAGQGIKSAGLIFAKLAVRSGYNSYDHTEYPSLIRGGHNVMQITVDTEEIGFPTLHTDLLVALNQDTINKYSQEITEGVGLIYDSEKGFDISKIDKKANLFAIPFSKFAKETGGDELMVNTLALGTVVALLDGDINILMELLGEEYKDKKSEIVELNKQVAELSYEFTKQRYAKFIEKVLTPLENPEKKMILNGNDAVALGAIAGGLQFAAIYPMSPASGILHVLAANQEKYNYVYKQPEDEISAINMCIGASFAGARTLTSTSGGGFSLMVEGYGLAGMTETPVVIVDAMRGGPATGLPTWSEQGDLQFVLSAHQGDFPRIVLSAGDPREAFFTTMKALNLADKYQTPVMILIDKEICENDQSFPWLDISKYVIDRGKFIKSKVEDYKRYSVEKDGISSRTIPGLGNHFVANSDEHDEEGFSSEEIADRNKQVEKRMKKLETCTEQDMEDPILFGPSKADVTLVSWGSNKGSILKAMKELPNVNFLYITWMNPFPAEFIKNILKNAKKVIDIESNYTGQLARLIRENTGIEIIEKLLKYDGRPIYPEEIIEKVKSTSSKLYD